MPFIIYRIHWISQISQISRLSQISEISRISLVLLISFMLVLGFLIPLASSFVINTTFDLGAQSAITFELFSNGNLIYNVTDLTNSFIDIYVTRLPWVNANDRIKQYYVPYSAIKVKSAILNTTYDLSNDLILGSPVLAIYNNNLFLDTTVRLFVNNTEPDEDDVPDDSSTLKFTLTNILIIIFGSIISLIMLVAFGTWWFKNIKGVTNYYEKIPEIPINLSSEETILAVKEEIKS